jgi:GNAT superfamily N-acetyltransferase
VTSPGGANLRAPKAEIGFRGARPDDAPATAAVVQAGFESYRSFAPPDWVPPDETGEADVERSRRELGAPETHAFVAEDAGRLIGQVRIVPAAFPGPDGTTPDWHFRHLFVLEPYWGTPVARTLHAMAVAEVTGVIRLFTPAPHARARRFYEREGWHLHHGPHHVPHFPFALTEYRLTRQSV